MLTDAEKAALQSAGRLLTVNYTRHFLSDLVPAVERIVAERVRQAKAEALVVAADALIDPGEHGCFRTPCTDCAARKTKRHIKKWLRARADQYRTEGDMTIQEFQAGCAHNFVNLSSFGDPYRRCQNCGLVDDRTEA